MAFYSNKLFYTRWHSLNNSALRSQNFETFNFGANNWEGLVYNLKFFR